MDISLTDHQATELRAALDLVISDMSPEIAGTDNADYRADLKLRRATLQDVRDQLTAGERVDQAR